VLGVRLHDVALGRREFEARLLRASRIPGRSIVSGRGNAIAEEVVNFGERHAAVGGDKEGKAVRPQSAAVPTNLDNVLRALTTSAPMKNRTSAPIKNRWMSGSGKLPCLSFSGHATRPTTGALVLYPDASIFASFRFTPRT
jgi:hypothetical protein